MERPHFCFVFSFMSSSSNRYTDIVSSDIIYSKGTKRNTSRNKQGETKATLQLHVHANNNLTTPNKRKTKTNEGKT